MASLDKLVRTLESLNFLHSKTSLDETSARRKEKISLCSTVTEMICSPNMKAAPNYSEVLTFAIESLLRMCNDNDTNVRMIADESLNKVIKAVVDANIQKVLYELFKEMKKNEKARSLRAALWRFADLSHFVRAQKGRNYMKSLIPVLINISTRSEDAIVETLATSMGQIFKNLAYYATDSEIKLLTHRLLRKLSSPSTVHRRCAVQSVIGVCVHSKKPHVFLQDVLTSVLDSLVPPPPPSSSSSSPDLTPSLLGGIYCISQVLAQYRPPSRNGSPPQASCKTTRGGYHRPLESETLLRIFELCLHLLQVQAENVTVVMFSLECLAELFQIGQDLPEDFLTTLRTSNAFVTSRIFNSMGSRGLGSLNSFSRSEASIVSSTVRVPGLDEDSSLSEDLLSPSRSVPEGGSSLPEGGSSLPAGDSSLPEGASSLPEGGSSLPEGGISRHQRGAWIEGPSQQAVSEHEEDAPSVSTVAESDPPPPSSLPSAVESEPPSQAPSRTLNIGSLLDEDSIALLYCIRFLVSSYLLPHSTVRVGVQTVTFEVLTQLLKLAPHLSLRSVEKDSEGSRILDILLSFTSHSDPQVRGLCNVLISHLVGSVLASSGDIQTDQFDFAQYVEFFIKGIQDESATCSRLTLSGLKHCLPSLLSHHSLQGQPSHPNNHSLQGEHTTAQSSQTQHTNHYSLQNQHTKPQTNTFHPNLQSQPSDPNPQSQSFQTDVQDTKLQDQPFLLNLQSQQGSNNLGRELNSNLQSQPNLQIHSFHQSHLQPLLQTLITHSTSNTYWLNHIKLIELLSTLPYHQIPSIYQRMVLNDIVLGLLANEDARIRNALVDNLESLVKSVYPSGMKRRYGNRFDGEQSTCFHDDEEVSSFHGNEERLLDAGEKITGVVTSEMANGNVGRNEPNVDSNVSDEGDKVTGDSNNEIFNEDILGNFSENKAENIREHEALGVKNVELVNENETISSVKNDQNARDAKDIDILSRSTSHSEFSDIDSENIFSDNQLISKDVANTNRDVAGSVNSRDSTNMKIPNVPFAHVDNNESHIENNNATSASSSDDFVNIVNYEKLFYICSRDLNSYKFLDDKPSRFWNTIKLEMFIDMFHKTLISELRGLGNDSNIPNFHLIHGCIDMLNQLNHLFPMEEYRDVWLQTKFVGGANNLVTILLKYFFSNSNCNVDLVSNCSILKLVVDLLVSLDHSNSARSENKVHISLVTNHLVKTLSVTANVVAETSKLKTNTLKKNLEKISPIKNFTKDRSQTISSPKSLHLPVTSFLAQPILSHVAVNTDVLSPVREEEIPHDRKCYLHEEFYSKLYSTVHNAHNNYKNSLKFESDFSTFLSNTLECLTKLTTVISQNDVKSIIAELSSSLIAVMNFEPCESTKCVYYILKNICRGNKSRDNSPSVNSEKRSSIKNEQTVPAVINDNLDKSESVTTVSNSPFDIFEPPSPGDIKAIDSHKPPSTANLNKKNNENNLPHQKFTQKRSSCKDNKENISFYESCITEPLIKVHTMLSNLNQFQSSVPHSSKSKFSKTSDHTTNNFRHYIIRKVKPHRVIPEAHVLSQFIIYLRLFEPCILSLFKQYSSIPNTTHQVYVLKLLTYIIQLGFNYYNIDPDLSFVQILIKQFELFEHGHVKDSRVLIPNIIKFLLTLCAVGIEKSKAHTMVLNESKVNKTMLGSGSSLASSKVQDDTIINLNKIIHMCDELYASGQDLQEHCIPGLKHIVKHVFIESNKFPRRESHVLSSRTSNSVHQTDKDVELDTQQEVLFINLLKLVNHHEVIFLLNQVLSENINGEAHQRRSTDVCQTLLRNIEHGAISFVNFTQVTNLLALLRALSPHVCEVDALLEILFKLNDFNEDNIVVNLANTIILLSTLFERYSFDDMHASIVRNKFASFSLDWNTEVDPLHVSITLDAVCVDPAPELSKLLLYLLYQTVTSYSSLSDQSRSELHSELVLNLILIYEHLMEKHPSLRTNMEDIIREEKRKKNRFFCDLNRHFRNESSVLLCIHFKRLTALLDTQQQAFALRSDNIFGGSMLNVANAQLASQECSEELYKDALDLLVSLDQSETNASSDQSKPEKVSLNSVNFNSIKSDEHILNLVQMRVFQLVSLQHEMPIFRFLLKHLKHNVNLSSHILDEFCKYFNHKNWLASNPNKNVIGDISNFLFTFFNLEIFAERILLLFAKHVDSFHFTSRHEDVIRLLLVCSSHVCKSQKCSVLSLSDVGMVLNPLFTLLYQCDIEPEKKIQLSHLIQNLLSIRRDIFGQKKPDNDTKANEKVTKNIEQWFLSNVKSLCLIPCVEAIDSDSENKLLFSGTSLSFSTDWHMAEINIPELLKKLTELELASVLNDKHFNMKLLISLINEGKNMLMNNKGGLLLEASARKLFAAIEIFLKLVPNIKEIYYPVHKFPDIKEIEYAKQMDSFFNQNDIYTLCDKLMDVIEEYFGALDEMEAYIDCENENFVDKSAVKKRSITVKNNIQKKSESILDDFRSNEFQDRGSHLNDILNKLKELNKRNANDLFKLCLALFNFLSYVIEHQKLFNLIDPTKFGSIINKTIRTNRILMNKFSFMFNILLQEDETLVNNIINCLYRTFSLYKGDCFTIAKHGNLNLTNSDSVTALFQLNTILRLIICECETRVGSDSTFIAQELNEENPTVPLDTIELFNLTLTLCKCDSLYTYSRIPIQSWEYATPIANLNELSLAALPTDMLLNVASLRDFVLRLKYVGWHSRVHFEQTWVILLTILTEITNNNEEDDEIFENKSGLYTLTVRGITELLIQTQLVDPGNRQVDRIGKSILSEENYLNHYEGVYVHSSRHKRNFCCEDEMKQDKVRKILSHMHQVIGNQVANPFSNTCVNYELIQSVYNINQLSYNYLHCALLDNEVNKDYLSGEENVVGKVINKHYINHMKQIKLINLDIQSCLHLLIDIYSQLLNNGSLRADIVESILFLSDLFDNYQHYEWMYAKFHTIINDQSENCQAMQMICAAKSLCFIKMDQKKDKLNGLLKRIISTINPTYSSKSSSDVLKLASMKCLFYLLENYVEKYIECQSENVTSNINIADKIRNSHLLNKSLDLIYNLIKTNTTWPLSIELEENFISLCLYVLETFEAFSTCGNYTPLVETLNIIVDFLCVRLAYYLDQNNTAANKLTEYVARIVSIYPKYQYLHKKLMNLCTEVIRKNKHYSVGIYSLFVICIYNRYYYEKIPPETNVENVLDDSVKINPVENETLPVDTSIEIKDSLIQINEKETSEIILIDPKSSQETLGTTEDTTNIANASLDMQDKAVSDSVKDPLANQLIENFFAEDKSTSETDLENESIIEVPTHDDLKVDHPLNLVKQDSAEDDDSFYKMITSKEKSHQIRNFFTDKLQNKKEKFKQLIKVRTNFDPLSNMLEKSTFYVKPDDASDMDESLNNTETDHNASKDELLSSSSKKELKQNIRLEGEGKNKFVSYIEVDRASTTTEDSERETARPSGRQLSFGTANMSSSSRTINEDLSNSIASYSADDSFAIIELISLFMSRMKQLNQEEMKLLSDLTVEGNLVKTNENSDHFYEFGDSSYIYRSRDTFSNKENRDTIKTLQRIHKEADVLSEIIPCIFTDFGLESDMLNRVVSEFLTMSNQNFIQLKSSKLLSQRCSTKVEENSEISEKIEFSSFQNGGKVSFETLQVQTKLSMILLHVLQHNQIDLINDWIVSTLSNLFQPRSVQLTSYYLFVFLCSSCNLDRVRNYFVNVRKISVTSLRIIVRSFYDQLSAELKRKFVAELDRVSGKLSNVDSGEKLNGGDDTRDDFRVLFENIFDCLGVKR